MHRSRPRQCDTSFPSVPAPQPLRVSSQQIPRRQRLNQTPSLSPAAHARLDTTLRSTRDPGPRLCWTQCLGVFLIYGREKGEGCPAAAGPPLKKRLLRLLAHRSAPGADGRVFVKNKSVSRNNSTPCHTGRGLAGHPPEC